MDPNQDSNQAKTGASAPEWRKNVGRLALLPREELIAIARKGGEARSLKKQLAAQLNPIKTGTSTSVISISRCNECPLKDSCKWYEANAACSLELNIRRNAVLQFKAFVGNNPEELLAEIMRTYHKLEMMAEEDPSFYKCLQQMHLLMSIYQMKFGGGK